MLEVAIIGGGLSGVALARSLHCRGASFALFEARERLGGRIHTVRCAPSGIAMDLGPAWFWPSTQPLIARLVADLDLADIAQHDQGAVLHLPEVDKTPNRLDRDGVHGGARRLDAGMAGLIEALAKELPPKLMHLGHVLTTLRDRGDHIALTFRVGEATRELAARRVVLTLPPRLADEHVRFEPPLDDPSREAMRDAETWMAAQAKVVIGYARPFWRAAGLSGNAFVTHEQAVIDEIFDACDGAVTAGALGGFLALSPELRQSFSAGLPMLMASQMVQVFGPGLENGEQHYQDWASEPYTCSTRDRETPQAEPIEVANPLLRRPWWDGKLRLGGAETASRSAGYLEGALEAAQRVDREFGRLGAEPSPPHDATAGDAMAGDAVAINAPSLARFAAWAGAQRDVAFDAYRQRLNRALAAQQGEQLTRRAVLESVEETYRTALDVLAGLPFDPSGIAVERGRCTLMSDVQEPFRDFMRALLDDIAAFNRTSCALSNFPDEHRLSRDYLQAILQDIAAAWQEFSLAANRVLLVKAKAAPDRRSAQASVSA